jgi:Flp pilus assembly protein TadD
LLENLSLIAKKAAKGRADGSKESSAPMRRKLLVSLVLVAATITVFWQVRHYEFIDFDDDLYVWANPNVTAGLSGRSLVWAFTATEGGNWHPLTWMSHMLDWQIYGMNPGGHHFTSVLFHVANSVLLLLVMTRMTGALWRSAFVAALFALHPLHVESVAWVAERKDVLSTLFWMLTMWTYVRYAERPSRKKYLLILVAFALGLMAKPMLVTLPFVFLLLDYWPLERFQFGQTGVDVNISAHGETVAKKRQCCARSLIWEKIPFFALSAVSSIIALLVQSSEGAVKSTEQFPLKIRIGNAFLSYLTYIGKMVSPQGLAVLYPHAGENLPKWQAVGAGVLLVGVTMAVIRAARRYPYLAVGWFWYLGTLVPVIGLVQVGGQALADRYTYVPLIGLFVILAWGVSDLCAKLHQVRILVPIAATLVVSALAVGSWRQLHYWQDSVTLFEHTLRVTTNNSLIQNNMGVTLTRQGKFEEAVDHFRKSLEIRPNQASTQVNLAVALVDLGKLEEAVTHYAKALELDPNHAGAHNNLGNALVLEGKLDEAAAEFSRALEINPVYAEAYNNLGVVLARQGKLDEAIAHFSQALKINPSYEQARINLGTALHEKGQRDSQPNPSTTP